jgi:hypothetical protein
LEFFYGHDGGTASKGLSPTAYFDVGERLHYPTWEVTSTGNRVPIKRKENEMRGLYKVYVVDPRKQGKLLEEATVIAKEDTVFLKIDIAGIARKVGLDVDEVDVITQFIGDVRARKEAQRVKVVKGEDEL